MDDLFSSTRVVHWCLLSYWRGEVERLDLLPPEQRSPDHDLLRAAAERVLAALEPTRE